MIRPSETSQVRCAVYARVSTSGQAVGEFSSIDNQLESAKALIASQAGNGWAATDKDYVDAGFSAATTNRPALTQLIEDVSARRVDVVIVYKLDRLSRNQRDLLELLDLFDKHGVAFKSVTQNFDTTGPMGRAMLGMLGVFAELERGMISERTRDKVMAARRRGRWTGGPPPLGYDLVDSKLIPNEAEAERVRGIYEAYLEHQSLTRAVQVLRDRKWTTKSWTTQGGAFRHGKPFTVASLRRLLTNPVYIGKAKCGDDVAEGNHDPILSTALWDQAQAILQQKGNDGGRRTKNRHDALLKGLLRCAACDAAMTPSYTSKGARRYRYYVCSRAQKLGWDQCPTKSLPAAAIERIVVEQTRQAVQNPALVRETTQAAEAEREAQIRQLEADLRLTEREIEARRQEQRRLAASAGGNGSPAHAARTALGTVAEELEAHIAHHQELTNRLTAIREQEIVGDEQRALLALLFERVEYHAENDDLELVLRDAEVLT